VLHFFERDRHGSSPESEKATIRLERMVAGLNLCLSLNSLAAARSYEGGM
jgi:hypothetical protein